MLQWRSDEDLIVGDTRFALPRPPAVWPVKEAADQFILLKSRWMVECYEKLCRDIQATNVLELGIARGGSTALLALLSRPTKLVAVELSPTRVEILDSFIASRKLQDQIRLYFGIDQADRGRLASIVDAEFGSAPLDLVVDDASHRFHATCASFNLLFPRLRPYGAYVIEDWSWEHHLNANFDREQTYAHLTPDELPKTPPLSYLILELALTAAYDENIIAEISTLRRGWTVVRRGPAALDPKTFDIAATYGTLGERILNGEISRDAP